MAQANTLRPMKTSSPARGNSPFQATKLWNKMIRNFKEGIEVKKRRWKMRTYENTFCGQDAVNWFLLYLRSNQKFGSHVTRPQAKMLLQKFLENGIFEDARGKEKLSFEDDNHLYRFTQRADSICTNKTEIATQTSVTNLLRSVSVRRKHTSAVFDSNAKNIGIRGNPVARSQSMRCALLSPSTSVMPPPEAARVTPVAKDLASFNINSAEKPRGGKSFASTGCETGLPSRDSKTISAITQPNFDRSDEENYNSILQDAGIDNRAFIVTEMSPIGSNFQRTRSLRDSRSMKYRHKFIVNCEEEDFPNEPSFVLNKSIRRTKLKRAKSGRLVTGISYAKTDGLDSPSKKAKMDHNLYDASRVQESVTNNKENFVHGEPLPNVQRKKSLRPSTRSDTMLAKLEKKSSLRTKSFYNAIQEIDSLWKTETIDGLKKTLDTESLDDFVNISLISDHDTKTNIHLDLKSAEIPEWTLSAMKFLVEWPTSKSIEDGDLPSYQGFEIDVFRAIQDHYECSLKEPLMTYNMFKVLDLMSDTISRDFGRAIRLFQYICLLIPTWNRKQIFLILRFMDKVSNNPSLKLSQDLPNKELVVRSFHRTVIRNKEMNYPEKDTMTSIRAVTFMMENHKQILSIPEELQKMKENFKIKENDLENKKLKETASNKPISNRPVSICAQCTTDEYAKQAVDVTRQALVDLLNLIVSDDTLHPKIKKKRLKEFKKNYPEIYQFKFPEDNISTCSTTSQRTLRIRQAIRPFFFNKKNSEF